MRCQACDQSLSDFEATRKNAETGEYLDLCNDCYNFISNDILSQEREDLRNEADNDEYEGE